MNLPRDWRKAGQSLALTAALTGEMRPDVDPREVILELLALNVGLRSQWVLAPELIDLPQVFETAADALLRRITTDHSGIA